MLKGEGGGILQSDTMNDLLTLFMIRRASSADHAYAHTGSAEIKSPLKMLLQVQGGRKPFHHFLLVSQHRKARKKGLERGPGCFPSLRACLQQVTPERPHSLNLTTQAYWSINSQPAPENHPNMSLRGHQGQLSSLILSL